MKNLIYTHLRFRKKKNILLIAIIVLCCVIITGCNETDNKKLLRNVTIASASGLLFNVIFDPLVGYFYKLLILGKPAAELTLAWNITATTINAVTSLIISVAVYMALRPALKKSGYFLEIK